MYKPEKTENEERTTNQSTKSASDRFLYPLAERIYGKVLLREKQMPERVAVQAANRAAKYRETEALLNPSGGEAAYRNHMIEKIRICLMVLLAGIILSMLVFLSALQNRELKEGKIEREDAGGSRKTIEISAENDAGTKTEIEWTVNPRKYKRKELENLEIEAAEVLAKVLIGESESTDNVTRNLNLPEQLEGYPFQISWEFDSYEFFTREGEIRPLSIPEEGVIVSVYAWLEYEDFAAQEVFYLQAFPPSLTPEEKLRLEAMDALQLSEENSAEDNWLVLPISAGNESVRWEERKDRSWIGIGLLFFFLTPIIWFAKDKELSDAMEKRRRQMTEDYPEVVSKLAIYLSAGMTTRNAFEKTVADYEKGLTLGEEKRYAYEEMRIACLEMNSGVSEAMAYDRFGNRCRVSVYTKLAALLSQNLRKGSFRLEALLREETRLAFEERKSAVRRKGEEAGTKLLIPLMMLLGVVMVMILIPVFMSF